MLLLLFSSSVSVGSLAGELDLKPPDNVSQEWRKLGDDYRGRIDRLREDRKDRGEKRKTVSDELDSIDFAKTEEQAQQDFYEAYNDLMLSNGQAAVAYFKGVGKRHGVLEAGGILLKETLPALREMYEAMHASVDMMDHAEMLKNEINTYNNEIKKIDKEIEKLEKDAALSERIADLYDKIDSTKVGAEPLLFELKKKATSVKQSAQVKHDQVPEGWVACNCPAVHAAYGRLFGGYRFHQKDVVTCPQ